ncbi:DEAD/DEAH box helicase [Streptomyces sp. NBC_00690]|uniref:DEAD/DEAH box helicase n=1 Tax=Streptomyces sp. NBC_00690 TaxID=2975808 RepID=UPI002E2E0950|nr:DEAD/DEAH box helicase [Streptomyces sp. NBC_00690]
MTELVYPSDAQDLAASCAAIFLPAALPREGKVAFWSPEGNPLRGEPGEITVVLPQSTVDVGEQNADDRFSVQVVPAVVLSVVEALPMLVRARSHPSAHPAAACWGAAALHALHLVAGGKLLPGLTSADHDAWRAGPLDAHDIAQLRAIAAAMPPEAHATPSSSARDGIALPEPEALVRAFFDAVADSLPRTPAAAWAAGAPFAAQAPQWLPHTRTWAAEAVAGMDAGVRVSLRLDLSAFELFDTPGEGEEPRKGAAAAVVQVHSLADPTLVIDAERLWAGGGSQQFGPRAEIDAVLAVRRAARVWPPLARLLERDVPDVLTLEEDELYELLGPGAQKLAAAGVSVHWPRELVRSLSASAVVRSAPGSATDGTPFFDSAQLLAFNWQLALDGDPLTDHEMDLLAESHRPMVRLRDQWVVVDPDLVRKARKRELGLLEPIDALAVALTGTAEVDGESVPAVPTGALAVLRDRLGTGPAPVPPPAGLAATLRDYQQRGLAWLDLMTSLGLGGCLADDMGLGKTVTLIALHLHRDRPEPTLVVCPASLLGNWQREITRFAPGVPVRRFHGASRTLDDAAGGFVLTTYGTMRSSAEQLASHAWSMVVADEAQHVKNPFSATAKALRTIPAPARVALTGTPVENNLSELWALLDWTTPGLLGPLKAFRSRHARLVELGEDHEAAERLARLVRPFLLRRKKSDPGIVPELPPKTESDHPVALTREQASLYEAVVREAMATIGGAEGIARRGLVMKLLTDLKQICNHPAQFLKEYDGLKGRGALPSAGGRAPLAGGTVDITGALLAASDAVLPVPPLSVGVPETVAEVDPGAAAVESPSPVAPAPRAPGSPSDPVHSPGDDIVPSEPPMDPVRRRALRSVAKQVGRGEFADDSATGVDAPGTRPGTPHGVRHGRERADGSGHGSTSAGTDRQGRAIRLAGRSGKLALLDELLEVILAEGDSVLVFTQYVTMARLIDRHLASRGISTQLLHGGTPVAERERMVDRFQSGDVPVFLLSLKAAGTGLNLTRAAHVIHFDRWWNPAVEEQATDRAYRIGQTQPVQVHRLIAEGTVEDRIAAMLADKRALADAVLGSGEAALTELSDRELADLVSLRRPA